MKYSWVLLLALPMMGVTATPADNPSPAASPSSVEKCIDNIPPTNVTIQSSGLEATLLICCPGIISNGGNDSFCLIGDCGVVGGVNGLTTTGSCLASVPLSATDYDQRVSSAYIAAGQPSVHNSALVTGDINEVSFTSVITATGAAATGPVTAEIIISDAVPISASLPGDIISTTVPSRNASVTFTAASAGTPSQASKGTSTSNAASGDGTILRVTERLIAVLTLLLVGAAIL